MLVINNDREIIERSIFEIIRLELVAQGKLPDIADTGSYPDSEAGYASYRAAIRDIADNDEFAIEVFGIGSSFEKANEQVPRIVVRNEGIVPGDIGAGPELEIENDPDNPGQLRSRLLPDQSVDYLISIDAVYKTAAQDRLISSILYGLFPQRGYVQVYAAATDPTAKFLMLSGGAMADPDLEKGIETRSYSFTIKDRWIKEPITIENNIPKISEITINNVLVYKNGKETTDDDFVVT